MIKNASTDLEKSFSPEKPNQQQSKKDRNGNYVIKSHRIVFEGKIDIHTIKTCNKSWNHQDNGNNSKPLYKHIEVIGHDRSIGFHSPIQNIGMYIGHLQRS